MLLVFCFFFLGIFAGERPEAMQTNAAVATKVQTSNPFTVVTTFVATLALWYALATFAKNSRNINSNITATSPATAISQATATATIKTTAASKIQSGSNFYKNIKSNNNQRNSNNSGNSNNKHSHGNNSKCGNCTGADDDDDKDDDNGNKADFITNKREGGVSFKEICNISISTSTSASTSSSNSSSIYYKKHQQQLLQQYNNAEDYKSFNVILLNKWNQRHALR